MIKIETHPNGYTSITGCSNCDDAPYLWFDQGEWVIDSDEGLRGHPAKYCPECGAHLTQRPADGGYCDCKDIVAWKIVGDQDVCVVCDRPRR